MEEPMPKRKWGVGAKMVAGALALLLNLAAFGCGNGDNGTLDTNGKPDVYFCRELLPYAAGTLLR